MSTSRPTSTIPTPIAQTITIRKLPWTYLRLSLSSPSTFMSASLAPAIDVLTARTHLTSALRQFLGLAGTAIAVDFLKVGRGEAWIRVAREDSTAVVGAVSAWTGSEGVTWRIRGRSEWLGDLVAGDGRDLFEA
ncbi:MAG: hypothetical protein Q9177_005885 [Variospora cf. flavescens]